VTIDPGQSSDANYPASDPAEGKFKSPMEAVSSYRGLDWTPQRLAFHQNLEMFAERVGLIVALQSNGRMSQERAVAEIRLIWDELKSSKSNLLNDRLI
jgi:hypothetical protein